MKKVLSILVLSLLQVLSVVYIYAQPRNQRLDARTVDAIVNVYNPNAPEPERQMAREGAAFVLDPRPRAGEGHLRNMRDAAQEAFGGNNPGGAGGTPRHGDGRSDTNNQSQGQANRSGTVLDILISPDSIFEANIEESLRNKDYMDLMKFSTVPKLNPELDGYRNLAVDTTAERMELKSKLMNALADLEWRLKIPVYEVDSKIVLLKSYLKTLLAYYKQLKDIKSKYEKATKQRVMAIVGLLKNRYRDILDAHERKRLLTDALVSSGRFKAIIIEYYRHNQEFKKKAAQVIKYIRLVDKSITKLKEKRLELEMSIISHQMDDRLKRVMEEAKAFDPTEVSRQVDEQWKESTPQQQGDMHLTKEAVADFLRQMGL